MAATYDPDPEGAARLSGAVQPRDRRADPDALAATGCATIRSILSRVQATTCKSLRGIYIDCGWRDQYHIHYGTRILSKRLAERASRTRYEEFDDNHSDVDYRMDVSLPFLVRGVGRGGGEFPSMGESRSGAQSNGRQR